MRIFSICHCISNNSSRTLLQLNNVCNSTHSSSSLLPFTAAAHSDLISILRHAKGRRLLSVGKMIHGFILRSGLEFDLYSYNNMLCVYLSSGEIVHARHLFEDMPVTDSVSWNTMISGSVSLGLFRDGLVFFRRMIRLGTLPTHPSFVSILVACAEMKHAIYAQQAHGLIIRSGFSSYPFIQNSLLKCCVKFSEYEDWLKMMNDMPSLDEISIQILMRGCVLHQNFSFAAELFDYLRSANLEVNHLMITILLSLCSSHDHAYFGVQVHGFSHKVGMIMDVSVVNSLITMYSRTYSLPDAEDLFELCDSRDIVTWNALLGGYAYNGEGDAGLGLLLRLLSCGISPNESTFLSFLSSCASINVLNNAKKAHVLILKLRDGFKEWTDNVILTMYCRTKSIEDAAAAFQAAQIKDSLTSNYIMGLYRSHDYHEESINVFHVVRSRGSPVDEMMFSGVLSSCSKLGLLELGCQIHGCVIKIGFDKISYLNNSILELYSQCGIVDDMKRILEESEVVDLFSWNMMLMGYANNIDSFHFVVSTWHEMLNLGIELNEFSYSALLNACCHVDALSTGESIHAIIHKMGLTFDTTLMNSLATLYSNCGHMKKAHLVFEDITSPDHFSWNVMISGYSQNGFPAESIELCIQMIKNGIDTNEITYASIFSSCTLLVNLNLGFQFYARSLKQAFDSNLSVSNSLITMYARCGNLHESYEVFRRTQHPDLITWNSMINAYAHHGLGREAISVFKLMNEFHEKPDGATFTAILSSCSRAGLVSEACYHFKIMDEVFGIKPGEEHCACLVDTLCRAGKLWDARLFIESMPIKNCSLVWKTLLSFCRSNEDAELGKVAAEKIIDLEPSDPAPYVILSDLYAHRGNISMKEHMRRLMENRGVKKVSGSSWICG